MVSNMFFLKFHLYLGIGKVATQTFFLEFFTPEIWGNDAYVSNGWRKNHQLENGWFRFRFSSFTFEMVPFQGGIPSLSGGKDG